LVENATLTIKKETPTPNIALDDYSAKLFTITVTNNGPSVAHDVVVTDIWPHELCQYPLSISFFPPNSGSAITTGADITATLGDIAPQSFKRVYVPFSVCERSTKGTAVNKASVFSPTDERCRDTEFPVQVGPAKRAVPVEVVEKHEVLKRSEPMLSEVRQRRVEQAPAASAPRADFHLTPVSVNVKAEWVGPSTFTVQVVNPQHYDVRITMVSLLGVGDQGVSVALDVTRVGPQVLRTTCHTFAERRLPHMWSQKCTVEVATKLASSRVSVSGISQQSDGPHAVSASTTL